MRSEEIYSDTPALARRLSAITAAIRNAELLKLEPLTEEDVQKRLAALQAAIPAKSDQLELVREA